MRWGFRCREGPSCYSSRTSCCCERMRPHDRRGGLRGDGGRRRRRSDRNSRIRRDIGIVFTDIQMPGSMVGLKLAHAIRGRWPPIRIVATSGLVDVGEKDVPEGGRFLPKPYHAKQVARVLQQSLG